MWLYVTPNIKLFFVSKFNSISLLNNNGILMCDDVLKKNQTLKTSKYKNVPTVATFETLKAYGYANIIETKFFKKRISKKYNLTKKYVSFSRLIIN